MFFLASLCPLAEPRR